MNEPADLSDNSSPQGFPIPGNLSKIEVFIISRIVALRQLGWSVARIADALGVDDEFVNTALQAYFQTSP